MTLKVLPGTREILVQQAKNDGILNPDRAVDTWIRTGTWEQIYILARLREQGAFAMMYSGALINRIKRWLAAGLTPTHLDRIIDYAADKENPAAYIGGAMRRFEGGEA